MPYTNRITDSATADARRALARGVVFPGGYPTDLPTIGSGTPPILNVPASYTLLRHGTRHIAYYRANNGTRNKLLLVSQGHGGAIDGIEELGCGPLTREACRNGIDVIAACMPGGDGIWDSGSGGGEHTGVPLADFVMPFVVGLNYAMGQHNYPLVAMSGISGGGWTTTLLSAIDARIQQSFPAAGSMPLWIYEPRDAEQTHSLWSNEMTYEEAYTIAARNGKQWQLLNANDPSSFPGNGQEQQYVPQVVAAAAAIGGEYACLIFNDSPRHEISFNQIKTIIQELGGQQGDIPPPPPSGDNISRADALAIIDQCRDAVAALPST